MGVLAAAGALDGRFTAVHATHVSPADIRLLGAAACSCCICPTTERDLADGIGPTFTLRDAGARLTLGSDSHAVIDLLEEARAVELDERLASHSAAATTSRRCCAWRPSTATRRSAGRTPAASRPARSPISPRSVWTPCARPARAPGDALAGVVFAATAADVRHVVVGGRVIVTDGQHTALDVARELAAVLA